MINLLPPQQKEEFLQERKTKAVLILCSLLLIFLLLIAIFFSLVKIYLAAEIQEQRYLLQSADRLISDPKYAEFEKEINKANESIMLLNNFYAGQADIVQILEKVSDALPTGVSLTNFSYEKSNSQIIIQGKVGTRDNLLIFKKSLEEMKEVGNFYSPVSNLIKSSDIDFYFSFNLIK